MPIDLTPTPDDSKSDNSWVPEGYVVAIGPNNKTYIVPEYFLPDLLVDQIMVSNKKKEELGVTNAQGTVSFYSILIWFRGEDTGRYPGLPVARCICLSKGKGTCYYQLVSGFRPMTRYSGIRQRDAFAFAKENAPVSGSADDRIFRSHLQYCTGSYPGCHCTNISCKTFKNVSNNFDLIIGNGLVTVPNAPVGVRLFLFLYTQLIVLLGFKWSWTSFGTRRSPGTPTPPGIILQRRRPSSLYGEAWASETG